MIFVYIYASFWLIGILAGVLAALPECPGLSGSVKGHHWWPSNWKKPVQTEEPSSGENLPDLARLRQLAHLGLGQHATKQEIREAYKRLSRVHHPDRFSGSGDDDIDRAAESFRRIREAYESLT